MPTDTTEQGLERLKNNLTKQTVDDAVRQYRKDRNPREKLFEFGRCVAHFALDENEVRFCTHLTGADAWFLPFDRGWNDGAGNPPNTSGIKTEYLWREFSNARASLTSSRTTPRWLTPRTREQAGPRGRRYGRATTNST
jgi:type I restriction enzyme R subunit